MKRLALLLLASAAAVLGAPSYLVVNLPLIPSIEAFAAPGFVGVVEVFVWSDDPGVTGFAITVTKADGSVETKRVNIEPGVTTMAWFSTPYIVGNPSITEMSRNDTRALIR